ncbi:hypothetical protein CEXT_543531 [Caerostris extrusa]|uniref:Uncharacterized protein n=1 Tax=Caerostris extrusa TaxID=172846 RepID=A0AAV4NR29_CAEEX|nr:hypothetical protein CEXT_543531 [Caerostris extrusa]
MTSPELICISTFTFPDRRRLKSRRYFSGTHVNNETCGAIWGNGWPLQLSGLLLCLPFREAKVLISGTMLQFLLFRVGTFD